MTGSDGGAAQVSYATWGEEFFAQAVTADRVLAAVNVLAGQPIDVGPLGVGPGRMVKVTATGEIGAATGVRVGDDPVSFAIEVPASLEFSIHLGVDTHRFTASMVIPLRLTARACQDLRIVIDVEAPTVAEVRCDLQAQGLRASVTRYAANVEGELKRFAATYVRREVEKPYVVRARTIDVSDAIDRAMATLGPRTQPDEVAADLPEALEAEIQDAQRLFPGEIDSP